MPETGGLTAILAFAPDGRRIVSGDQDGGLRTLGPARRRPAPAIPPRRGQVAALSVSGDGRYLLQSHPGLAGPGLGPPGRSRPGDDRGGLDLGCLAPDGRDRVPDHPGRRATSSPSIARSGRPATGLRTAQGPDAGAGASAGAFRPAGRLARRPAARGRGRQGPLACVWDAATGRLVQTIRGHERPAPDHRGRLLAPTAASS